MRFEEVHFDPVPMFGTSTMYRGGAEIMRNVYVMIDIQKT